jgi:hypothetical protein
LSLKPSGFSPGGAPLFDAKQASAFVAGTQKPTSSGGGQAIIDRDGRFFLTVGPKPFAAQSIAGGSAGKATWSYPSLWPGLHASQVAPLPEFPGELIGTTRLLGNTVTPRESDAGEIVAINGNKGNVYLFTTEGLFVATLFKDSRTASWSTPQAIPNMTVNDVSLLEENFWPSISQTDDGTIYLVGGISNLLRVEGLDKIRRLKDAELSIGSDDLSKAGAYFVEVEQRRQQKANGAGAVVKISMQDTPVKIDGSLSEWTGASWAVIDHRVAQVGNSSKRKVTTDAALAVSGDRLFIAVRTDDLNLLENSGESLTQLFKTGGGIDLMLGVDSAANTRRVKAVAGDLRLLVSQVKGKTVAMLYQPIVTGSKSEGVPFSSPIRTIQFDLVSEVSGDISLARAMGTDPKTKIDQAIFEISIPLATLGLKPSEGLTLRGDIGILRGNGFKTLQRAYWHNKATGLMSDVPSEAELTPQLWGTFEFVANQPKVGQK